MEGYSIVIDLVLFVVAYAIGYVHGLNEAKKVEEKTNSYKDKENDESRFN